MVWESVVEQDSRRRMVLFLSWSSRGNWKTFVQFKPGGGISDIDHFLDAQASLVPTPPVRPSVSLYVRDDFGFPF